MKKLVEYRKNENHMVLILGKCLGGFYVHRLIRFPVAGRGGEQAFPMELEICPVDASNADRCQPVMSARGISDYLKQGELTQGWLFLDPETKETAAMYWLFFQGAREAEYRVRGNGEAALISDIYVFEPYRGKRLAARLLDHALSVCGERGVRYLYASVRKTNPSAWRFYDRVGYEDTGTRRFIRLLWHNFPQQYVP